MWANVGECGRVLAGARWGGWPGRGPDPQGTGRSTTGAARGAPGGSVPVLVELQQDEQEQYHHVVIAFSRRDAIRKTTNRVR